MRLKAVPAAWSTGSSLRRKKMRKMFEKSKKMFVLLLAIVAVALSGGYVSSLGLFGVGLAFRLAYQLGGTLVCQPFELLVWVLGYAFLYLLFFPHAGVLWLWF